MAALDERGRKDFWVALYDRFDPRQPVTDPQLRVARTVRSPAERILEALDWPRGTQSILLAGGIGSGKSTELRHVARQLTDADRVVVLVDLWEHFERVIRDPGAVDRLQPWEIVGLLGLAVVRAGTEHFGHDWAGHDEALHRALAAEDAVEGPTIDVASLATGLAVVVGSSALAAAGASDSVAGNAGLQTLQAVANSWAWKVGLRDRRHRGDQDEKVRAVLDATSAIIEHLQTDLRRRVVLILDGLDRVRDPARFERLFVDSSLLADLPCDLVVAAHLALVQRFRGFLTVDKRFDLSNEPVAAKAAPWDPGPGTAFFAELVERRLDAMRRGERAIPEGVFPRATVERLAWCSGGRLRDFVGFVQALAERGYREAWSVVPDDAVSAMLDEKRRQRSDGLNRDEIALLQEVARDPDHRLPGGPLALDLLQRQLLLPYPNEETWYLPHALLMISLVTPG